jgi:hypothetical protein
MRVACATSSRLRSSADGRAAPSRSREGAAGLGSGRARGPLERGAALGASARGAGLAFALGAGLAFALGAGLAFALGAGLAFALGPRAMGSGVVAFGLTMARG